MTNRTNADFLQVFLREAREDPFVYFVFAERSLVLSEAQAPQPTSEVHDGALTLVACHCAVDTCLARHYPKRSFPAIISLSLASRRTLQEGIIRQQPGL